MDATMQHILRKIKETRKTSHKWQRQVPFAQPHHRYSISDQTWRVIEAKEPTDIEGFKGHHFTILSWNIDFMLPLAEARMSAALHHLDLVQQKASSPCVIFLQEMIASDLSLIKQQPWVQAGFNMTDITPDYWESGYYGTCTLVSKLLPISAVFRVHYEATSMERDALFVDIALEGSKSLRLCNTHLESLVADQPKRPQQLETASAHMHALAVQASVLGGDLNAIQEFDANLHTHNDLQDAYLVTTGQSHIQGGETWGQMARTAMREQFGLSRMDKLLFCGDVQVDRFETFGLGVEVFNKEDKRRLVQEGLDAGWVTDHLGVLGEFRLLRSAKLT